MSKVLCTQCGLKPPIVQREGGHLLCVDCNLKFVQAFQIQQHESAKSINHLLEMAEARVGLTGVLPRIQTSEPIIHSGDLTFNNISVEGSVVGAINTGELHKLDLAMTDISASGNAQLARYLQALTQAVVNSRDIADDNKNEAVEILSYLSSQAILPKDQRQTSLGKTVLSKLETLLNTSASLATLLNLVLPHLTGLFR
jgi:hypothetical protein